jgi:hypothetical protein
VSEHTKGSLVAIDKGHGFTIAVQGSTPRKEIAWMGNSSSLEPGENHANAAELVHRWNSYPAIREALEDMLSGWKYIREVHGDLYGVGWDRAQEKAKAALAQARGKESGL